MGTTTAKQESYLLSIIVILCFLLSASACAPMRASPFSEKVDTTLTNSNAAAITSVQSQLKNMSYDEKPVRFAVISDSHANYRDLDKTIHFLNQQPIDFTVHLGDMTDLGLAVEYDAFVGMMSQLKKPWLAVLGNHDAVGNGHYIYKKIFGEYNQSFVVQGYRFILFNNNALEFGQNGIQLNWLEQEITNSAEPVILFQHADPFNKDNFSQASVEQIKRILTLPKIQAVFHGHMHKFNQSTFGNTWIQEIHRTERFYYAIVELKQNSMTLQLCQGVVCENNFVGFTESAVNF